MKLRQAASARFRLLFLFGCCAALLNITNAARAQFIFLDSNGDALSTQSDILNSQGSATTVTVYLDTSHNPDGSLALCDAGQDSLTLNSYEVLLHSSGGTVAYGSYTNLLPTANLPLGTQADTSDFYIGFAGGTILAPGKYELGTLSVTVVSGTPTLNIATTSVLNARYGTTFGTKCTAHDGDNTYKLGLDWFGSAGCGPPSGGNSAPALVTPNTVTAPIAEPVTVIGDFADPEDSLSLTVTGLPSGFIQVQGRAYGGHRQLRAYGVIPKSVPVGTVYSVKWAASDGSRQDSSKTSLRTAPDSSAQGLYDKVHALVSKHRSHGLNRMECRALGTEAAPIMCTMLRDPTYKRVWHRLTSAIGFVGDTAYFDTLYSFIWSRFQGPIDRSTFMAVRMAQVSLNAMATLSPRILQYLERSSTPAAWASTPWVAKDESPEAVARIMSNESLIALGYTDSEAASEFLQGLAASKGIETGDLLPDVLNTNTSVRQRGYLAIWHDQDFGGAK